MNLKIKGGCTRHVLLIGKYAIKIPRLNYGWQLFLKGLLGNMQEVKFSSMKDDRMCPVLFSLPGGLLLIMPSCESMSEDQFACLDMGYYWQQEFNKIGDHVVYYGDCKVPVEHKIDSFGIYQNRIVAIDYGS